MGKIREKLKTVFCWSLLGISALTAGGLMRERTNYLNFMNKKEEYLKDYVLVTLHNHSNSGGGDGIIGVEDYIKEAYTQRYSICSLSEHEQPPELNAYDTLSKLEELAKTDYKDFEIEKINDYTYKVTKPDCEHVLYMLNGVEVTIQNDGRDAHVLGIGIKYVPDSNLSLEDLLKDLSEQGALIGAPHPTSKMAYGLGEEAVTMHQEYFDFVELNGSLPFPTNLIYNKSANDLGKKTDTPVLSFPDAHLTDLYFNKALVMVEKSEIFNENDIVGFLKSQFENGNYKNVLATTNNFKLYQWILIGTRQ